MSWWVWTLVSIGAYLVAGVTCAIIEAYLDGKKGENVSHGEYGITVALWPILVGMMFVIVPSQLIRFAHRRGATKAARDEAREDKRNLRRQVEELADQEGLDKKQLMKTLVG